MPAARLIRVNGVSDGFQKYEAYEIVSEGFIEALNAGPSVTARAGEFVVLWEGPDGSRLLQLRLDRKGEILETYHMAAVPKELLEAIRKRVGDASEG